MAKPASPRVVSAFFADAHKLSDQGKVDAFGVFDTFNIWGLGASRECSLVTRVVNLPVGTTKFKLYLRASAKADIKVSGELQLLASEPKESVLTASRLTLTLDRSGPSQLGIAPPNAAAARIYWVPFSVALQPWIELPTGAKLKSLLDDPQSIKAARAALKCNKCGRTFTFELSLDPARKLTKGSRPFPSSGKFKCPKCAAVHQLRDIEGQLRSHLGQRSEAI